jgi:uncharacterized protein YndB with AHSA1/START domain
MLFSGSTIQKEGFPERKSFTYFVNRTSIALMSKGNKMGKIAIERSIWIAAPRERVWQAVTDPAQIAAWFAPGTSFSQHGNIISIRVGEDEREVALIEVFDPPRQITTRSLPDRALATTYTLEEENGGTRFTVTETGFEALSEEARQAASRSGRSGLDHGSGELESVYRGQEHPTSRRILKSHQAHSISMVQ